MYYGVTPYIRAGTLGSQFLVTRKVATLSDSAITCDKRKDVIDHVIRIRYISFVAFFCIKIDRATKSDLESRLDQKRTWVIFYVTFFVVKSILFLKIVTIFKKSFIELCDK